MKLRYTRKGWYRVLEVLTGTFDFRTKKTYPDEYGCLRRVYFVGPYDTAREAGGSL